MTDRLVDLKGKHSDVTRDLEKDAEEEQRIRADLKVKQDKLQAQANSDSQEANALIEQIIRRREKYLKDKTKLEGKIELLEDMKAAERQGSPKKKEMPPSSNGKDEERVEEEVLDGPPAG